MNGKNFDEIALNLKDICASFSSNLNADSAAALNAIADMTNALHRLKTEIVLLESRKESLSSEVTALVKTKETKEKELLEIKAKGDNEIKEQKENFARVCKIEGERINEANRLLDDKTKAVAESEPRVKQAWLEIDTAWDKLKKENQRLDETASKNSEEAARLSALKVSLDLQKNQTEEMLKEVNQKLQQTEENLQYIMGKTADMQKMIDENNRLLQINQSSHEEIMRERERLSQIKLTLDKREKAISDVEQKSDERQADIDRQYKNLKDKEYNLEAAIKENKGKK